MWAIACVTTVGVEGASRPSFRLYRMMRIIILTIGVLIYYLYLLITVGNPIDTLSRSTRCTPLTGTELGELSLWILQEFLYIVRILVLWAIVHLAVLTCVPISVLPLSSETTVMDHHRGLLIVVRASLHKAINSNSAWTIVSISDIGSGNTDQMLGRVLPVMSIVGMSDPWDWAYRNVPSFVDGSFGNWTII